MATSRTIHKVIEVNLSRLHQSLKVASVDDTWHSFVEPATLVEGRNSCWQFGNLFHLEHSDVKPLVVDRVTPDDDLFNWGHSFIGYPHYQVSNGLEVHVDPPVPLINRSLGICLHLPSIEWRNVDKPKIRTAYLIVST